MSTLTRLRDINRQKVLQKSRRAYKHWRQQTLGSRPEQKQIAFILGCQRSGTSLMIDIFDKDFQARVFPEYSKLSSQDPDGLRLNPLPDVKSVFDKVNAPLIVSKPLVETQNALKLLRFFPDAKIIWMYRHYQDVAASKLKKSGMHNGIRDMQYIVEQRDHWRSEHVPDDVRNMIVEIYAPDMNPYDGAALYWYVRNNFLFHYHLHEDPRVLICRYEDFVQAPEIHMQKIYDFLERPYPGNALITDVFGSSVGKGQMIDITESTRDLCDEMWSRLNHVYERGASIAWPSGNP